VVSSRVMAGATGLDAAVPAMTARATVWVDSERRSTSRSRREKVACVLTVALIVVSAAVRT
jgi:hypothetical protein